MQQQRGSATMKGLVMLAVSISVPWYLMTHTPLPKLLDGYLSRRSPEATTVYDWGGGDAPGWQDPAMPPAEAVATDRAVVTATYETPALEPQAPTVPFESGFVSTSPAFNPGQPADRFTAIERRLHELGASYFVLETVGRERPKYRFLCRTSLAGNQTITQKFEAVEPDALTAMQNVLDQVEQWHTHGLR